jgi:hypothetical protein
MLLLALPLLVASLTTVAEESGFERTGRFDEVVRLCDAFPKAFPRRVRCDRFGVTPEGRPLLALVASSDGVLDAKTARARSRPVVLAQGGIHAGEIDGKDAGFQLLRELLEGKTLPGVLDQVTLVFVPVFNVDGFERFGPNQRPNQNGPAETGWRVTGQNLNLNRDYAKADAPEMQAMLGLLATWDPILYVDLHVTDGAKFEHDVAVLIDPQPAGFEALRTLGAALRTSLFAELAHEGHLPVAFYPDFRKTDDPASGFALGVPTPRFQEGYWSLRNRFAALVETHSWRDYRHRVRTMREVLAGLLERAATSGRAWKTAADAADRADETPATAPLPIAWTATEASHPIPFRGYAYARELSAISGQPWIRYDDAKPEVWTVPLYDTLEPSLLIDPPKAGYIVPAPWAALVGGKLALHGFRFETLPESRENVTVASFRADDVKFRPEPYESHLTVAVKGAWKPDQRRVPAGSLFVPVNQRGRALLLQLLEPAARDSLVSWGFFNAMFERKEYMEAYVLEPFAQELVARDAAARDAFEEKLRTDPDFARSPEQRLLFFAKRHPSWDDRLNLYPVWRVDVAPATGRPR